MTGNKILIIGIDGATFNILDKWIDKGELATFQKLKKEGSYCKLNSTVPPVTPPAWTTITTGVNPGKHNIFDFQKINEKHDFYLINAKTNQAKDFWEYAKKKIIVLNFPNYYPPKKLNGYMVGGMLAPGLDSEFTYPKELKKEILELIPDYKIEVDYHLYKDKMDQFLIDINKLLHTRYQLFEHMLKKEWDIFFGIFTSSDRIQHIAWNNDNLLKFYKELDKLLGKIVSDYVDKETALFIVSDHGFAEVEKLIYVNSFLRVGGYLETKQSGIKKIMQKTHLTRENVVKVLDKFKVDMNKLKVILPTKMKSIVPEDEFTIYQNVDWKKTKAFMFGFGQVFINSAKRFEKAPISAEEHDEFRDLLKKKIEEIKDPKTGKKIVKKVYLNEEVYSGDYAKEGPDLIVEAEQGYAFSEKIGDDVVKDSGIVKADHHKEGIFMAFGRNIKQNNKIKAKEIVDFAPTVLAAMGEQPGEDMDGRAIEEVFEHTIHEPKDTTKESVNIRSYLDEIDL